MICDEAWNPISSRQARREAVQYITCVSFVYKEGKRFRSMMICMSDLRPWYSSAFGFYCTGRSEFAKGFGRKEVDFDSAVDSIVVQDRFLLACVHTWETTNTPRSLLHRVFRALRYTRLLSWGLILSVYKGYKQIIEQKLELPCMNVGMRCDYDADIFDCSPWIWISISLSPPTCLSPAYLYVRKLEGASAYALLYFWSLLRSPTCLQFHRQ
jgi:multisubunit Na+/H+ antiporter MnhE subunit